MGAAVLVELAGAIGMRSEVRGIAGVVHAVAGWWP